MEMFLLRTWNNHVYSTKISFKFPNPPCQGSNLGGKVSKRKEHACNTYIIKIDIKNKKTFLLVCRVGVRGGQLSIYLITKIR